MRDHISSAVTSETKNTATPRGYCQGGMEASSWTRSAKLPTSCQGTCGPHP